jgi:hypothetical protein
LGDPKKHKKVFRWDVVELNLPGSSSFVPSKPWVSKLKIPERMIACDFFIYVDDVHTTGDYIQTSPSILGSCQSAKLLRPAG